MHDLVWKLTCYSLEWRWMISQSDVVWIMQPFMNRFVLLCAICQRSQKSFVISSVSSFVRREAEISDRIKCEGSDRILHWIRGTFQPTPLLDKKNSLSFPGFIYFLLCEMTAGYCVSRRNLCLHSNPVNVFNCQNLVTIPFPPSKKCPPCVWVF